MNKGSNCGVTGFTGHVTDCELGLTYMQARSYDPVAGRFLSVDGVGFLENGKTGQFNRYTYTFNNPMNATDPDGFETRLMIENQRLDMEVVNGNMTFEERQEYNRAQFDSMLIGLSFYPPVAAAGLSAKGLQASAVIRPSYLSATARISPQAYARSGSLRGKTQWAFQRREVLRDRFRKLMSKRSQKMFQKKDKTFEGQLKKYLDDGLSEAEAYHRIIDRAAFGHRKSANTVAKFGEKVTCTGSRIKRDACP